MDEVKEMILRHARLQVEYKGPDVGMREMRKHVAWYTAGFPHSAKLRSEVNAVGTLEELGSFYRTGRWTGVETCGHKRGKENERKMECSEL